MDGRDEGSVRGNDGPEPIKSRTAGDHAGFELQHVEGDLVLVRQALAFQLVQPIEELLRESGIRLAARKGEIRQAVDLQTEPQTLIEIVRQYPLPVVVGQ